jgi:hypothetical protein
MTNKQTTQPKRAQLGYQSSNSNNYAHIEFEKNMSQLNQTQLVYANEK